jgi:hypothetical protein
MEEPKRVLLAYCPVCGDRYFKPTIHDNEHKCPTEAIQKLGSNVEPPGV